MEAFLVSLTGIAIAEVGDRTQLLSLVLAARFRKPWPIIAGVLCATLINHGVAAWLGSRLGVLLQPAVLDAAVGISMVAMGLWALRPDELSDEAPLRSRGSVFVATLIAFFLAETGDKTQIATLALGAAYPNLWAVIGGSTSGMLLANAPVVFFGSAFAGRLPLRAMRYGAAALFLVLGCVFVWRATQFGHNAPLP
ncbi:MAG: TMEM165/GDT1 family protein [Steroidobacterales bacterium]